MSNIVFVTDPNQIDSIKSHNQFEFICKNCSNWSACSSGNGDCGSVCYMGVQVQHVVDQVVVFLNVLTDVLTQLVIMDVEVDVPVLFYLPLMFILSL